MVIQATAALGADNDFALRLGCCWIFRDVSAGMVVLRVVVVVLVVLVVFPEGVLFRLATTSVPVFLGVELPWLSREEDGGGAEVS